MQFTWENKKKIIFLPWLLHKDTEQEVKLQLKWNSQVHPCGRYRHNTVVFILAKEYNLKNLRTIHRLDRLTSGILLFGRTPKKARQMEHQIRNRQVSPLFPLFFCANKCTESYSPAITLAKARGNAIQCCSDTSSCFWNADLFYYYKLPVYNIRRIYFWLSLYTYRYRNYSQKNILFLNIFTHENMLRTIWHIVIQCSLGSWFATSGKHKKKGQNIRKTCRGQSLKCL